MSGDVLVRAVHPAEPPCCALRDHLGRCIVSAAEVIAEAPSVIDRFLAFADAVQAAHQQANRSAYAETCPCGGSVEVGRDVHRTDLRTIHADFLGRHINCTKESS